MKIFILERAYLEIPDISLSLFVPEPDCYGRFQSHNGYAIYLEEYQDDYTTEAQKFLKEMGGLYKFNSLQTTTDLTALLKKHNLKHYTYMPKEYKYGTYTIPKTYFYTTYDKEEKATLLKVRCGFREDPFPSHKIPNVGISNLKMYNTRAINKVEGYYQERHPEAPKPYVLEKTSNYIREFIVLNII